MTQNRLYGSRKAVLHSLVQTFFIHSFIHYTSPGMKLLEIPFIACRVLTESDNYVNGCITSSMPHIMTILYDP